MYISQLIKFARGCCNVDDYNVRNKCLTAKLLRQGLFCHFPVEPNNQLNNCTTSVTEGEVVRVKLV